MLCRLGAISASSSCRSAEANSIPGVVESDEEDSRAPGAPSWLHGGLGEGALLNVTQEGNMVLRYIYIRIYIYIHPLQQTCSHPVQVWDVLSTLTQASVGGLVCGCSLCVCVSTPVSKDTTLVLFLTYPTSLPTTVQ